MEEPRRLRNLNRKVCLGLAILFAVLLLFWLAAPGKPAAAVGVDFKPVRSAGGFNFVVAVVTNPTQQTIYLETPIVQWEAHGAVSSATANLRSGLVMPELLLGTFLTSCPWPNGYRKEMTHAFGRLAGR